MRTRALALLAAAVIAAGLAGQARADGDPASDYLITEPVFFPYDAKFSPVLEGRLLAMLAQARKRGFRLKVALIPDSYDLGVVTALWRKPKLYARFLATEDAAYFKGAELLVVMPNGFGFDEPRHATADEYALLARIPIGAGPDGLLRAAITGVEKLAAARGIEVKPPATVTTPAQRNRRDRLVIVVAVLGALAVLVLARLGLRRRLRRRRT